MFWMIILFLTLTISVNEIVIYSVWVKIFSFFFKLLMTLFVFLFGLLIWKKQSKEKNHQKI